MKYRLLGILLCAALVLSAGCVSLGQQTTDIMIGNESVGTVTLLPKGDGTVSVEISILGMTFTKDGMTQSEAEAFAESAAAGNLPGLIGMPENAGTPSDTEEFINSILHMPITNTGENSLAEGLNFTLAAENAEESAQALENLLTGIFEKL